MGNEPGRMIVIEKQPKEGSALDPGSFAKQVSPSKMKLTRKPTPNVDSSLAKLPIPHVDRKAQSKTNPPSVHPDFIPEYKGQPPPKTVAASYPSDSSLSETDVPEIYIPWTLQGPERDVLMYLQNIHLLLSSCCKDIKMKTAVMEDVVKLAEGIKNNRWYLCEDLDAKINFFRHIMTYTGQLQYVPELHQCVKENIAHMESKTSFSDSSESVKESRPKKKFPNPAMQREYELMERQQLAEKEAKEARLKAKQKSRNRKVAAKARAVALALVTATNPPEGKTVIESTYCTRYKSLNRKTPTCSLRRL